MVRVLLTEMEYNQYLGEENVFYQLKNRDKKNIEMIYGIVIWARTGTT